MILESHRRGIEMLELQSHDGPPNHCNVFLMKPLTLPKMTHFPSLSPPPILCLPQILHREEYAYISLKWIKLLRYLFPLYKTISPWHPAWTPAGDKCQVRGGSDFIFRGKCQRAETVNYNNTNELSTLKDKMGIEKMLWLPVWVLTCVCVSLFLCKTGRQLVQPFIIVLCLCYEGNL